jgi:hypothetical protein
MGRLEMGLSVVASISLAQDRYRWRALVNAVKNLRVPRSAGKLPSGCTTGDLSSGAQLYGVGVLNSPIHKWILRIG